MSDYIEREAALAHPFANGGYDHVHANEHFIFGHESYKEWLEQLPAADVVPWAWLEAYANGKRTNYCSDWVLEARAAYREEKNQ